MKLETKLALSTGGFILVMFVSAFTAHLRILESNRLSQRVMATRVPLVLKLRDVRRGVSDSIRSLEGNMLFGLTEETAAPYRKERATEIAQAERSLAAIEDGELPLEAAKDETRVRDMTEQLSQLKTLEEKVEKLNQTKLPDDVAMAYTLLHSEILPLEEIIRKTTGDISVSQNLTAQSETQELQHANRLTIFTLWLATILGALIGGSLSIVLGRRIAQAVQLVASRANSIAEGDLTGEELRLGTNDQTGALAEAMNRMQTALCGIIGTVADTAGSLTGSALSMRSASDQIHRRIDQQSQQTQQAATAMQEMSASIAEVSRHTHSAAETARAAAQTARDGGIIVKEMLASMHSIALAVTETSSTVGLLGEDSRRISQIVTVIDEIARKTNLLALNAAIEAARAGEQGRGFAVVAGEVRRLAESTAQATGEIGSMIQEIQDRTRTAIASMASGTGTVEQGVITTTQAGEALERIIGMAERVDRMITQIAIAAQQQATAADRSSESLDSIHSLSHENLTEMATTAAGIENLRGTAVTLEKQVDRFHLQAHPAYTEPRSIYPATHPVPA